jgi:hypothetical protein
MDRRRTSLVLLLLFVLCTGVAIVVSGSRPGLQQGIAPTVVQSLGYVLAFVAAVLLLSTPEGNARTLGGTVLGALVVLVLVELLGGGGTDIGAGFVRLIALVVVMVVTVRLALGAARTGRTG